MPAPVPCTVAMLTFNSARTLPRALESIQGLAELVVADGGSTDDTRRIVEEFGGRVIDQPRHSQDGSGRLVDYGAARDHLRHFATQPWILELDSDEYLTPELVADLRTVCVETEVGPNRYTMLSRYEVKGKIIDCATTYPMIRPRLFRASACSGYRGMTDEEAIVAGASGELTSWFVVPYPDLGPQIRKWWRYLHLDRLDYAAMDPDALRRISATRKSTIRWFLRDFRRKRSRNCQSPLPFHLELVRFSFYVARYVLTLEEKAHRHLQGAVGTRKRRRHS